MNPALSYGALGIVGLGFTSLSTVDALVNHTGTDSGRSLLYHAFKENPSEPNYIGFALQRSTQPDDDVEGTFSIGPCLLCSLSILLPITLCRRGGTGVCRYPEEEPYPDVP